MAAHKKSRIDVAVFPVAGRGTRFLPATKASPKEMLPIVDKPLIQYAVEEALEAGADACFHHGIVEASIEDHFEVPKGRRARKPAGQAGQERLVKPCAVCPLPSCIYIRRRRQCSCHAVLCAIRPG